MNMVTMFIADSEFPPFLDGATLGRPLVILTDDPQGQRAWFEQLVTTNDLAAPAYLVDRGVLLTVWPAEALPSAP
jgi:hypothetical protein